MSPPNTNMRFTEGGSMSRLPGIALVCMFLTTLKRVPYLDEKSWSSYYLLGFDKVSHPPLETRDARL